MIQIDIPGATFDALMLFRAKNDIRTYLTGACVSTDATGAYLVTTDGYMLACARVDSTPRTSATVILPLMPLKGRTLAISVSWEGEGTFDAERGARQLTFDRDGTKMIVPEMEWQYPDWRRTVRAPLKLATAPVLYNPNFLATIDKAAQVISKGKYPTHVRPSADNASGFARIGNDVGVWVMPMRGTVDELDAPFAWVGEL